MPKISKVLVKIESVIENLDSAGLPEGDAERSVSEAEGLLALSDEEIILNYTEEGDGGRVVSEIRCYGDLVTVKRSGAIESELHFKEGEEHRSLYSVPPYKFDACVRTRRIRKAITADGGSLDLIYNMKIGGADKSARMRIWIRTPSSQS